MKYLVLLIVLAVPGSLLADDFRDGVVAYQQRRFEQAFTLWLPLAEQGHVLAQTLVGSMYAYGEGVEQNDELAFMWLSRAAEVGSAQAQYNLAIMYEKGLGVSVDLDKARHWYEAAASQGREDAVKRLALLNEPSNAPGETTIPVTHDAAETPTTSAASSTTGQPAPGSDSGSLTVTHNTATSRVEVTIKPKPMPQQEALLGPPAAPGQPAWEQAVETAEGLKGAPWILQQEDKHYTIQLAASVQSRLIEAYIEQLKLETNYAHTISAKDGRDWHAIIYGSYPTAGEARKALAAFPAKWRTWQPWIRSFASIKKGR